MSSNIYDIIDERISDIGFTPDDLVNYAESGHGYMADEGFFGVTYPDDLDEYEKVHDGRNIPNGMVEIDYWDGEDIEVLISLSDYLHCLIKYLEKIGETSLVERVNKIVKKNE